MLEAPPFDDTAAAAVAVAVAATDRRAGCIHHSCQPLAMAAVETFSVLLDVAVGDG